MVNKVIKEKRPINIVEYENEIFYPTYIESGKYFINIKGDKIYNKMFNKFHKIIEDMSGYLIINVSYNYKNKYYKIHRMVADVFKIRKDNRDVVNHIDGDVYNNHPSNLEWVYAFENARHGFGYSDYRYEDISESGTLYTKEEVTDIYTSTLPDKEIIKKYSYKKLNKQTLNDIRNNITYKYITKNLVRGYSDINKKRNNTTKKLKDKHFVESLWFNEYFKKGKSSLVISKEQNISKGSLLKAFKKFYLPLRKSKKDKSYNIKLVKTIYDHDIDYFSDYYYKLWFYEMLENNKSLDQVYKIYGKGHSPNTIKDKIKKYGLPIFNANRKFVMKLTEVN